MDRFASQRAALPADLDTFSGRNANPCKSVGITLRYPVHSDLTSDQLQYYSYWKTTVGTKDFRKAADGYVWLLVCEILNDPDKERASHMLNELCTASAGDWSPLYPELLQTAIEFSLIYGTPMPGYKEWMPAEETLPWLLSSPVSDLPYEFISKFSQGIQDIGKFQKTLGTVLREYDGILRTKGKTLKDICMEPVKESSLAFRNHVLLGEKVPVECITWKEKPAGTLSGIIGFVASVFNHREIPDNKIPMASELERITLSVLKSGSFTPSPDPFAKTGNTCRRLGSKPTKMGPSCLDDHLAQERGTRRLTFGDVLTFGPVRTSVPSGFVCSDMEHPTYDDLSEAQYSYYSYWKSCFDKDIFLDTDNGYVNLYLTELINEQDIRASEKSIRKLLEVYGDHACIASALVDHIIGNGGTVSDFKAYTDRLVINNWISDFVRGRNQSPLDADMLNMMRSGTVNIRFAGHPLPLKTFENALHKIFSAVSLKKSVDEVVSVEKVTVKRSIFFGLDYFRGPKETVVRYINYLGCRKFTGFIDKAAKYASDVLDSYRNGTTPKKTALSFGGVNCGNILAEELFLWHTSNSIKASPRELKLDAEAVATAESDLRIVTDLMRIEEEEEATDTAIATETTVSEEDPWKQFFASLDDIEKTYLEMRVDGTDASNLLRELKRTRNKMDDMINSKSLDTVGDTVLEDGDVVEDYLEEIKKGL